MPVVMGTAGHIDHGKTSLVRALTDIECDRLEEEKRRGITIDLGFAHLDFSDGRRLSIVDVPGHERFVKTMAAGATGIDFVMLVIAADEGVMPQTREHLEICSLLGVRAGLVAITKIDAVDPELLEMAQEDIKAVLQGSFLEHAPLFPVSSRTKEGIPALRSALEHMTRELARPRLQDIFVLPIDRIFTMKGHGTVITGTMTAGSVRVGDEVALYPSGWTGRVRSLQSHGVTTDVAPAGRRTAVNLQGIELDAVSRGDVLGHPGELLTSLRWEAKILCLSSSPRAIRHRSEIHLHHGTKEIMARVYLRDKDVLPPGESAICQLRFSTPMTAIFGDRFILRSFSPLRTVGGGCILHPTGLDLRKNDPAFETKIQLLHKLDNADDEKRLLIQVELAGKSGVGFNELRILTNLDGKKLEKLIGLCSARQQIFCYDREHKQYIHSDVLDRLSTKCLAFMADFHNKNQLKQGITKNALSSGWGKTVQAKLLHFLVERLIKEEKLAQNGDTIYLPGYSITLASGQNLLKGKLLNLYTEGDKNPPTVKEAAAVLAAPPKEFDALMRLLLAEGDLVRVADGLHYAKEALTSIENTLRDWFLSHETIDASGFKDITGLSRKFAIPLLEHFDNIQVTIRVGDKRLLRKK